MNKFFAMGSIMLATVFTACEKEADDDNVSAQDRSFAAEMSLSNRTEIALGQLAVSRSGNDSIRRYAERMVTEHTSADAELRQLADDLDIELTGDSLNTMGASQRTVLVALSGRAFDSAYINGQVSGHQMTLQLAQTQAAAGTNGAMRSYANKMVPAIQLHLAAADTLAARY